MKALLNILHWRTLMAATWRALVALFDWRTHVRRATFKPILDCVFVTNMRDDIDRARFLGKWRPGCGHFNGPRFWINGISGRTRALDITTEDLATAEGRERAQKLFIKAVEWAQERGAKVALLAASTKRLFGEDAAELKELFPEMVFTLGDNGTMLLLENETLRALEAANVKPGFSRVAVIGPYGFLGEHMTALLIQKGFNVVGVGANKSELERVREKYGIEVSHDLSGMGKVKAIVACTHSKKVRIGEDDIARFGQKVLVVDVSEPSNLKRSVYLKCKKQVIRQDAGNAFSPRLKYVLGPCSYLLFRLTRGVAFGCFAETLSLAFFLKREKSFNLIDWMSVSSENMNIIKTMFTSMEFGMPTPRNFGKPVKSFDLEDRSSSVKRFKFVETFAGWLV
jgi:predicted amino acid dehydrogenase